jgi:hypothetical protein
MAATSNWHDPKTPLTEHQFPIKREMKHNWAVGEIIRVAAHGGGFRVWRVTGVFLGIERQEAVVELETLDRIASTEGRMCVPVELLDGAFGAYVLL